MGGRRGRIGKRHAERLIWVLRLDRDGFSVDSARKKGRRLPDWYLDEPEQPPLTTLFHEAFRDLATCRTDGPIPWDKTMAYAERKGLTPDVADAFWTVIRKMDQAERRWQIENIRRNLGNGGISDRSQGGPADGGGVE